jgi:hypothetical protein
MTAVVELVAEIGGKEKFRVKHRTLKFEGCGTPSGILPDLNGGAR